LLQNKTLLQKISKVLAAHQKDFYKLCEPIKSGIKPFKINHKSLLPYKKSLKSSVLCSTASLLSTMQFIPSSDSFGRAEINLRPA